MSMQPYGSPEHGATPGQGPGYGLGQGPGYVSGQGGGAAPGYGTGAGAWPTPAHPAPPAPYGGPTPGPAPYPMPYPVPVAPEKSAGIAILLSFLWLGAGHLYLNRVTPGVLLLALDFFLLILLFIPIINLLAVVGWIVGFIVVAINCSSIATEENRARAARPYGW